MNDAFGQTLYLGASVHFAGRDLNGKPTINQGLVDALNEEKGKVRVLRVGRSSVSGTDKDAVRRVWVEREKVARFL